MTLTLLVGGFSASSYATSLYSIGNSLSNDMYPDGLQLLAQDSGLSLDVSYHIRSSASLTYMLKYSADVTLARPSTHDVALVTHSFDAIALEPYAGFDSPTYVSERDAIIAIIERVLQANAGQATFYLYSAWPNQADTGGDFDAYWRRPWTGDVLSTPVQSRSFYDALLTELRAHFENRASLRVIPIGDVLARIDRDAKAGFIPNLTDMSMLYRDSIHMGEVGRFVAASTVISTLYQRQSSASSAMNAYQFNDGVAQLTEALALQLEQIIWSEVAADDRTRAGGASSSSSASSSNSSSSAANSSSSGSSDSSSVSSSSSSDGSSSSAAASSASAKSSVAANSGRGSVDSMSLIMLLLIFSARQYARSQAVLIDVDARRNFSQS
ncbi:MAG: hypothetical protein AB7F79_02815 [Steroidobacteraceae bacterium]